MANLSWLKIFFIKSCLHPKIRGNQPIFFTFFCSFEHKSLYTRQDTRLCTRLLAVFHLTEVNGVKTNHQFVECLQVNLSVLGFCAFNDYNLSVTLIRTTDQFVGGLGVELLVD